MRQLARGNDVSRLRRAQVHELDAVGATGGRERRVLAVDLRQLASERMPPVGAKK